MLKSRKNKTFNYTSRFSKKPENNTQKHEENSITRVFKNKRKRKASTLPILLIILGLVIALMYYLNTKLR